MKRLTQTEKTQLTRSRLKQSALKSFAQKGVNSAGIEEIARGAGYSKGAFYGNYTSKFELLLDMLEEKQLIEVRFWKEANRNKAALLRAIRASIQPTMSACVFTQVSTTTRVL